MAGRRSVALCALLLALSLNCALGQGQCSACMIHTSHHKDVWAATAPLHHDLPAEAVNAHEHVVQEFQVGGAAMLRDFGTLWFVNQLKTDTTLARRVDGLQVVAILVVTIGCSGFLSPPGDWNSTTMKADALANSDSRAFNTFFVLNGFATVVAASMVTMTAFSTAYGGKPSKSTISGWSIRVALSIQLLLGAYLALAIGFLVKPAVHSRSVLPWFIVAVLYLVFGPWFAWHRERKRSFKQAGNESVLVVRDAGRRMVNTLSKISERYAVDQDQPSQDMTLALYLHQYAVLVMATTFPLFFYFLQEVRKKSPIDSDYIDALDEFVNGAKYDTSLYHRLRDWANACQDIKQRIPKSVIWIDGAETMHWPELWRENQRHESPSGIHVPPEGDDDSSVRTKSLAAVDLAASTLMKALCQTGSDTEECIHGAIFNYRLKVKEFFLDIRLYDMIPPTIRNAQSHSTPDSPGGTRCMLPSLEFFLELYENIVRILGAVVRSAQAVLRLS